MTILLFGTTNVGKSVTAQLLASRLRYRFYDLDDVTKKYLGITLEEFVHTWSLRKRDHLRCELLSENIGKPEDKVVAVTPLSYMDEAKGMILSEDVLPVVLKDSAENIFDRLVFSDENDTVYTDDEYKNRYRNHYLREIRADQEWYGQIFSCIPNQFDMDSRTPMDVVESLIKEYHLGQRR